MRRIGLPCVILLWQSLLVHASRLVNGLPAACGRVMRRSPGLCNCSLPNCLPHVMRSSMVATLVTRLLSAAASGCSWLLEPSSSSNSCRSSGVPAEFSNAFIDSGFAGAVGTCDGWAPFRTSRHMSVDHPYAQRISSSTLMRSRATIMPAQRLPPSNCMSAAFAMSPLPCTSLAYFSNGNSFTSPSCSRHPPPSCREKR